MPSMTVAQNLYLGEEKFFNRLRGIYIAAQQFLQSLQLPRRPDGDGRRARRRQEADGRDRPRRAAQRPGHHLRRADRDPDARGEAALLRPDAPSRRAASRSSSSPMRWRRRCRSPTASRSCATASMSSPTTRRLRPREDRPRDGRPRPVAELYGRAQGRRCGRRAAGAVVQNLDGPMVRNTSFSVFAGQITGVFGLIGSGRTETFKIVAGVIKRDFLHGGEVLLHGKPVRYRVPRAGGARRHRLRHRGPQDRGLLRDHVDRREHLSRPARQARGRRTAFGCRSAKLTRSASNGSSASTSGRSTRTRG